MKVLTAGQCKALDRYTIEHEPILPIDLMERASMAITREICCRWDSSHPIILFAGPGNNGGDALAVARLLAQEGYRSQVFLFNVSGKLSPDCQTNMERLAGNPNVHLTEVTSQFCFPIVRPEHVIVDGLFGTGLNKPLNGGFAGVTQQINASGAPVVSIDIPSGLMCDDNTYNYMSYVVRATLTLTLQTLKPAFLFAENQRYLGEVKLLDIGLMENGLPPNESYIRITEPEDIHRILRPRDPFAHKGTMGHGLLVSGQYGMAGAAILATRACLRSGAGKVTVHTPRLNLTALQISVPEAIIHTDPDDEIVTRAMDLRPYRAVAIGPGIGTDEDTAEAFHNYLMQVQCPLVLDADALNLLGLYREWIQDVPEGSILTPHPKELEQLTGQCTNSYERMTKAADLASRLKLHIVVKGHNTLICMSDGSIFCNPTGNAGMATAGSGDVLTGVLLGLLTRGYTAQQAATLGVYLHGLAGDIAADRMGQESMTAGDIVNALPAAFRKLIE
ncbi:MAG: NAD(P)H-hydrate dehydratase [Clostridium sp.]|nr:NAD(P)H-hydrate dehydratase [Clostridium sp.]